MVARPLGRRWSTRLRHGAAAVAALALLATGCAGGPAASPVEEQDGTSGGQDAAGPGNATGGQDPDPSPPAGDEGTDDGKAPAPTEPPADPEPPPPEGSAEVTASYPLEGLVSPWALAPLPNGDLLIGDRATATIYRFTTETETLTEVGEVRAAEITDSGGLLGLAADGGFIYAHYTTASDIRIMRLQYDPEDPEGQQLSPATRVLPGLPQGWSGSGGKIAFGPDSFLYAATSSPSGSSTEGFGDTLLRMTSNGNEPDEGNEGTDPLEYTSAADKVQSFAWDEAGRMWLVDGGGALLSVQSTEVSEHKWAVDARVSDVTYAGGSLWAATDAGAGLWRVPLDGPDLLTEPELIAVDGLNQGRALVGSSDGRMWALDGGALRALSIT